MIDILKKPARWLQAFDLIRHRALHYRLTFQTPEGKAVLMDLAKFCRANDDTIAPTEWQTHVLIGRREVWLRIQKHLTLTPEELTNIFSGIPTGSSTVVSSENQNEPV